MSTEGKEPKKSSRRDFARLIAAAGASLPLMALNAEGQTRKRKKKSSWGKAQTSPITVGGGGSVAISFNHKHYTGGNGRYSNAGDEVMIGQIFDKNAVLKWEISPFVKGINCKVTIHTTRKNGAAASDIIIRSNPRVSFGIKFDETIFPLSANDEQLHYQEDRKIVGAIEILNIGTNLTATLTPPSAGVCTVRFHNTKDTD
ncbi:MAG: hypothetical protein QOF62_2416 [Pyrinomonadaceae bacterium]|jgi:hypothetical protein|nr:hypothetical protein [Pyrinomonadaceae bacterium]